MASNDSPAAGHAQSQNRSERQAQAEKARPSPAELLIRFWGVRGSYPVPGPHTVRYGGNTACVEVRNAYHRIILDAGTGLIALGDLIMSEHQAAGADEPREPHPITILLSHTHHDHIQALPFFLPAYSSRTRLYVYGPQLLGVDLRDSISLTMTARYCPVRLEELNAHKIIENLADSDRLLYRNSDRAPQIYSAREELPPSQPGDLLVSIMRSYAHPKDGVFVFKIANNGRRVVYASDIEGYTGGDARLIEFARDADVLIHDAQYTHDEYADPHFPTQGFGHSTVEMACEVARKARVGRLILFHHDPRHADEDMDRIQEYARTLFKSAYAAHEGMEIHLSP
ncbi:MAG: MBL fold metallo-hydrolase [candidate division KSB1 bacterium]|nr:MBL fold metallo-hydrolase [candidate division KSB1 bacterium]MDZ7272733.1 MBL fold metallo-hydrolase [candidate division KSB1 bacterium]MDZ7284242.1 MBL fold metallo-hydrolase [candidate division KSB1 bacterium]MDZ7297359.1 MBL fold metallo-hydrolase [candidate division KSB1 bacterium]MDZ7307068.1 MBL fold metallo-hydrolase [candidate division KSB1 bacterium]